MTMHTIPVRATSPRADFLSHLIKALPAALGNWQRYRRRRADLALLMSMEPRLLQDIGIAAEDDRSASAMLQWHPAVLATTLKDTPQRIDPDR